MEEIRLKRGDTKGLGWGCDPQWASKQRLEEERRGNNIKVEEARGKIIAHDAAVL